MILLAFINNNLPKPIAEMLKKEPVTNTRQSKHFASPLATRNYRLFTLSCNAPRIWNAIISPKFKNIVTVPRSKSLLKKEVRK